MQEGGEEAVLELRNGLRDCRMRRPASRRDPLRLAPSAKRCQSPQTSLDGQRQRAMNHCTVAWREMRVGGRGRDLVNFAIVIQLGMTSTRYVGK